MPNLLRSKKFILLAVFFGIVAVIALLLITGALKFSFKYTPASSSSGSARDTETTKPAEKVTQKEALASRPTEFSNPDGKVSFSIKLPLGWSTASDSRVDFVAGSLTPEKLSNGQEFTANLNAIIDTHPTESTTFADYQKNWKDMILAQYPSMAFLSDSTTTVDGMDVYILNVTNARPDGQVLNQTQYVYYVDDTYALVITTTVPEDTLTKYESVLEKSLKSVKKIEKN